MKTDQVIILAQIEGFPTKKFHPGHPPTVELVLRFIERHGFEIHRVFLPEKYRNRQVNIIIRDQYGDGTIISVFADGWLTVSGKPCTLKSVVCRFVDAVNLTDATTEASVA